MTISLQKVSASSPVLAPALIAEAVGDKIHQKDVTQGGTLLVSQFQGGGAGDVITVCFSASAGAFIASYTLPANPTFPIAFLVPATAFTPGPAQVFYWITSPSGNVAVAPSTFYTVVP